MNKTELQPKRVAIIGAGPAGLTAAYTLLKKDKEIEVTIIEADPQYVGGISRTVRYKDFRFDIGGHRFFSKSKEVEDFWTEILPNDMLDRPRSSRIFYRGEFFSYPLKAFDALLKLGVMESALCMMSYGKARLKPVSNPKNFEDWVSNQFGKRLFSIFFKTYTEKVWGMNCKDISADWAAQRIKGLSLASAVKTALLPKKKPKNRSEVIKTLIDTFRYPRLGPGMMWEACAEKVKDMGGKLLMGQRVSGCNWDDHRKTWSVKFQDSNGEENQIQADHIVSSAPLRELGLSLTPKLPESALKAAGSLRYRDFLTVALIIKDREQFSDNWIYIHDPNVKVGRIQNFKSWSPEMVPNPELSCYGLEYFCFEGDGLWSSTDEQLLQLAKSEIEKIGLAKAVDVVDGCVVRQAKAYPIYDDEYAAHVESLKNEMETRFPTLHVVGRNGMHKYNNQDHAMMTAMLCAENILAGERLYDVWQVNQDAEYHESGNAGEQSAVSGLRAVPRRVQYSS
ncbi:MAG: NAD(P)/FAD-dependent oxidoreductase [Acidobacteriota bacterium]|nr:NAD(P)/FAD-dependent oxidoreductase [Acidobacteriota bacterium]